MNESDARAVLLVRAVEHERPEVLSPEVLDAARREAGPAGDLAAWLVARARLLLARLPADVRALSELALPPAWMRRALPVAAGALGLASNLLGPTQRIHAVWNPVTLLLVWNAGVIALALFAALRTRHAEAGPSPSPASPGWVELPARLAARLAGRGDASGGLRANARLRARLLHDYAIACRAPIAARATRLLAVCAVAFALGALAGVLLRGVAFEYRVAWSSTLVPDPGHRALIARILFFPAALLLGPAFPDAEAMRLAASADGAPAAIWIGIWAICVATIVLVPRLAFILAAGRHAARAARDVAFDLSDPSWSRLALPPPAPPGGPLDPRVLGWFVLDAPACTALASLESALVADDVKHEAATPSVRARASLQDHAARKGAWHEAWKKVVTQGFEALPAGDRPHLLGAGDGALEGALARVRANANRFAAELVLLELAAFEAYWPLAPGPDPGAAARVWASLAGPFAPRLRSEVRDTGLRRAARALGLPESLGASLRAQLDRSSRELAGGKERAALGIAAGAAVGLLGFGIAAPVLALVAGKALGVAGAAVAVKAGLAALGGGAVLAGGVGLAGRSGAIVGGGALLALAGDAPGVSASPAGLLLSAAKIEVFLRAIVVGRQNDRTAARDVLAQLRAAAEAVHAQADRPDLPADERRARAEAAVLLDTVLRRNEEWARTEGVLTREGS